MQSPPPSTTPPATGDSPTMAAPAVPADEASAIFPTRANICILGAGAIGGLLGVHLSRRGHHVTFLARGPHLAAMRAAGALTLVTPSGEILTTAAGTSFVSSLADVPEPQHVIIVALKMHQVAAVLPSLPHVLSETSIIVTAQNGIPWWYFQRYAGPQELRGRTVESVDPGGKLKNGIDARQILATVVYPAAHISAPGEVTHVVGVRFPIGELDGSSSPRVRAVSEMLIDAGFKSPVLPDVRAELWLKLCGAAAVNPLSALTHAPLDVLCARDSPGRDVVTNVMCEVSTVAKALGATMRLPLERRVDGAGGVRHKTSMLQDAEAGRELEIDSIIGAVVELARLSNVPTPSLDAIYSTIRMLVQVLRDEKAKVCLLPVDS